MDYIDRLSKEFKPPYQPTIEEVHIFLGYMADRILALGKADNRAEALWKAQCYLQIEESDGQFGGNKQFGADWDEKYAHELADNGIQRDAWQEEDDKNG